MSNRDFFIAGESLVRVQGPAGSLITPIKELGLSDTDIRVSPEFRHEPLNVDAWGGQIPIDMQFMLASLTLNMTLIHFDNSMLEECLRLSAAGGAGPGTGQFQMPHAGTRLGGGIALYAQGNNLFGLQIDTPNGQQGVLHWRFPSVFMVGTPMIFPLGTKKSVVQCIFQAIPYQIDPWYGANSTGPGAGSVAGTGAYGTVLYDHNSF